MWPSRCSIVNAHTATLLLAYQAWEVVSADCAPYPVAATIGTVKLSNDHDARGVVLSVGTPEQDFAFLPQWPLNNVMVYGTDGVCTTGAPTTEDGCTTWRGGQYDKEASDTQKDAEDASFKLEDDGRYPDMNFVTDSMKLNDNVSLSDLPMGIPRGDWGEEGYHPMMAIGLGKNSSVLNALKSAGNIASRTWSMFYGWTGQDTDTQRDGTFVFGGYDRAKVSGDGFTTAMTEDDGCSSELVVIIDNIVLNFPDGSNQTILPYSSDLIACIEPDFPVLISLPAIPYFRSLESITKASIVQRSQGLAYNSMLYGDDDIPYEGAMTFELKSGPHIRIPNHQLIVPERTIDDSGEIVAADIDLKPNLVIESNEDAKASGIPRLGRQFLSSAYIMVNQDAREFTVWSANPSDAEDLVAVDDKGNEITEFCEDGAYDPKSSTTSDLPSSDSGLSTGAIAGIAVGSVVAVAALGVAAFLMRRHRRKTAQAAPTQPSSTFESNSQYQDWTAETVPAGPQMSYYKPELQGETPRPRNASQEYELAG